MSWQRIDENTYIDDTLVTCAEYQLFIDEMREQGKYYQPDHWTSYQFPKGQALEPVLGVRHSDAMAFCEWLTKRENIAWTYRLPTRKETKDFLIIPLAQNPVGYWTYEKLGFAWVGLKPYNPRALDIHDANDSALEVGNILADQLFGDELDLDNTLIFASGFNLNRIIDRTVDRNLDHALEYARDKFATNNLEDQTSAVPVIFDIVTLQERIAGRSPAFEGIRLVKERIR